MAKAGFFKVGKEDNDEVRCFVCLNVFEHWDRGDDPFKEHGSLYPDCHFAILQKEQADFTVEDWIRIMNQRKIILNVNNKTLLTRLKLKFAIVFLGTTYKNEIKRANRSYKRFIKLNNKPFKFCFKIES